MIMKILLFLSFLTLLFSCRKDKEIKPLLSDEKAILIGYWDWYVTYEKDICSGTTNAKNPETESMTYSFFFEEEGFVSIIRNDSLLSKHWIDFYVVEIPKKGIVEEHKTFVLIIHLDGNEKNVLFMKGETGKCLVYDFPFRDNFDCFYYVNYFRKRE